MQDVHRILYPEAFNKNSFHQKTGLTFKKETNEVQHFWSMALYDAETWTLRKVDKYLESSEVWCWRKMKKISWPDRLRNEDVLQTVSEERNILHTIQRGKTNWIGHILRRNGFLKHITEGKIERRSEEVDE